MSNTQRAYYYEDRNSIPSRDKLPRQDFALETGETTKALDLSPLPEHLRGQKDRTISEWLEVSQALEATAAYAKFRNERTRQDLFAINALDFYRSWSSRKLVATGIAHPWFYRSIWEGVKLWGNRLTQLPREKIASEVYSSLGNEQAYGASHAIHNTGVLPLGVQPDYESHFAGLVSWMHVPREVFGPDHKWVANDRATRIGVVQDVVKHLKTFLRSNEKAIVLDVGGGNGELSLLLAQHRDFPANALVVVQEPEAKMIQEGREKLKTLRNETGRHLQVVFIQSSATQDPFLALKELAKGQDEVAHLVRQFLTAPVGAVMSTFVIGAMQANDLRAVANQLSRNLSPGAKLIIADFADPTRYRKEFIEETGNAGKLFCRTRALLRPPLNNIYKNWDHAVAGVWSPEQPGNMDVLREALTAAGHALSVRWNMKTVTILPLPFLSKKKHSVVCTPLPSYAEMVISCVKPR